MFFFKKDKGRGFENFYSQGILNFNEIALNFQKNVNVTFVQIIVTIVVERKEGISDF
jgi:hypothetical protein